MYSQHERWPFAYSYHVTGVFLCLSFFFIHYQDPCVGYIVWRQIERTRWRCSNLRRRHYPLLRAKRRWQWTTPLTKITTASSRSLDLEYSPVVIRSYTGFFARKHHVTWRSHSHAIHTQFIPSHNLLLLPPTPRVVDESCSEPSINDFAG